MLHIPMAMYTLDMLSLHQSNILLLIYDRGIKDNIVYFLLLSTIQQLS